MSSATEHPPVSADSLDRVVAELQQLRIRAGDVSYAAIATRIAQRREAAGMSPAAARIARSSVFDAFRPGRHRLNAELVWEIALALGEDQASAERWRRRSLDTRMAGRAVPLKEGVEEVGKRHGRSSASSAGDPGMRIVLVVAVLIACVGLNFFGNTLVAKFHLPIFLDMIGTAIAAIAFGPWPGAAIGLASNVLTGLGGDPASLPFALVNVTGALVWGYGVHRFGLARTPLRLLLLSLGVAVACSLVAAPITVLLLHGVAGHGSDEMTAGFVAVGQGLWTAVLTANMLVSIIDKLITGMIALAVMRALAPLSLGQDGGPQSWSSSPSR